MLSLTTSVRILVCLTAVDCRKSFGLRERDFVLGLRKPRAK